ncbi:hypothetical protein SAMN05216360_1258 [Methylobacterium phyllostachyos]|uniref:Uncharacterized protein n=1 Tax=Methylobacterium phyllostachyos TaxID=582672 RepID=A0A1H0K660_9HYPH|nr:hypothetical protein [Methylobacterium phyllostachyos]SDO51191.1 hypothetical protein SAMN05216360_1258 [Methylobacterium phyllostachyos]
MGRHETFENAAPFADELLAGTILGRPLLQDTTFGAVAPGDDPVHGLIAEHRAAFAEWDRLSAVWNEMVPSDPGYAEAMAASNEPGKREAVAFDALFSARPTSLAGATALASYLVEIVERTRIDAHPGNGERALGTIAAALRGLEPSRVALADVGLTSEISEDVFAAIEDHRDIMVTTADPSENDEEFDREAAMQNAAERAVAHAPVRSLADLRAKLTYLLPIIAPDMLDRTHIQHLEAIRADMDRLCRERSRPADNHEDAELLRLGEQLDRAHARWRVAVWQYREPEARLKQALEAARARGGPTPGQLEAAWNLPGVEEAHTNEERAFGDLDPICEAIWRLPASTPAGLAVKARAALAHVWPRGDFEAAAADGDEETLTEKSARRLIEACCTLAGVDWRGDPIAPPLPDPIFPAIERHLAARAACLGLDDGRDKEGYEAAHDRRIAALDAVEGTRPTTVAGLLALARHMQTYLTGNGEPPEHSFSDKEHAFAGLIQACLGLHAARYPGMDRDWAATAAYHPGFLPVPQHQPAALMALEYAIPQEAARLLALAEAEFERRREAYVGFHDPAVWPKVAADLRRDMRMDALAAAAAPAMSGGVAAGSDQRATPDLVGILDLESATMDELQTIQDLAEHVGAVAYAYAWGPCCHRREHPLGASDYNEVGKLMHWLGDALTDVESAVDREVAGRVAGDRSGRETRLSMRAVPIIDNGDPDAIEAFARELLDHAAAEREGR